MLNPDLIRRSIVKSLKHKKKTKSVKKILNNLDHYTTHFYNILDKGDYRFSYGTTKTINSKGKVRNIQVPTLYDHIIQHIMMAVLSPVIIKSMYRWNCGVVPGRGPIYAKNYVQRMVRKDKPKYALELDIEKYFHNIDTNALLAQIERKVKDKRFLKLLKDLLDASNGGSGKGIPIGFYSSQWLSALYLENLDYYIKQTLEVKSYARYVDNIVLVGNNKRTLHRIKTRVFKYMDGWLGINPNKSYQVFPIASRKIDFIGYRFSYTETEVRKSLFYKFMNKQRELRYKINKHLCQSYLSLRGWLVHSDKGRKILGQEESKNIYHKAVTYISSKDIQQNQRLGEAYKKLMLKRRINNYELCTS